MNEEKGPGNTKEKKSDELDILKQLEEARKDSIETLKKLKTEVFKSSVEKLEETNLDKDYQRYAENFKQIPSIVPKDNIKLKNIEKIENDSKEKTNIFLDDIGNLPSVDPNIINRFKINTVNLLNSRIINPAFLDLESSYYYISILKMLGIEFPFTSTEIVGILKNYISNKVFSYSKNNVPDPINIFYGLAITTELDLIHRTDLINLQAIKEFLIAEFKIFIPEKLKLNHYTLQSLKMLEKSGIIPLNKEYLLSHVLGLDLLNIERFNPVLDIYNYIGFFKILDRKINTSKFNTLYINELKKHLTQKGSIDDLITNSAKTLLILSLLDMKNQESILSSRLLNFIIKSTEYFSLENLDKDFNWRIDKLAYKIELRMLFWSLLACTQYTVQNFLNL